MARLTIVVARLAVHVPLTADMVKQIASFRLALQIPSGAILIRRPCLGSTFPVEKIARSPTMAVLVVGRKTSTPLPKVRPEMASALAAMCET